MVVDKNNFVSDIELPECLDEPFAYFGNSLSVFITGDHRGDFNGLFYSFR